MAQDLRKMFKNEQDKTKEGKMSQGHAARFLEKLDEAMPEQKHKSNFKLWNIAASVVILLGLSFGAYQFLSPEIKVNDDIKVVETNLKTLGDVSPDLKKVEDFYLASINLELSKVELTPENKELFDGYIQRLKELNEEYDKLTIELNENGPNEETLDALIDNLKYRLNLVMRLKEKLQEFNNETFEEVNI